jgi:NitT/TauT family transport system ATP-binding protein
MKTTSKRAPKLVVCPAPVLSAEPSERCRTIRLDRVSMTFGSHGNGLKALDEVDLTIRDGDFIALVGPSGCGKSTILRLVSGLLSPGSGRLTVDDRPLIRGQLGIGIAFQNPTMLPWLTIERNVMMPLKIVEPFRSEFRAKRRTEFRDRVHELLAQVGLEGFADRYPWQLSGGMLQRASLCRALIHEPQVLLLDEPFGALDQFTREELWGVMQSLWMQRRPTVLLVTHDLREAAYLANRVCVMSARPGRIISDEVIDFPRPRTIAATYEQSFVAMMLRLRALIFDERKN